MNPINQRGVDLSSSDRPISDICGGRHLMDGVVCKQAKRVGHPMYVSDGRGGDYLRNTLVKLHARPGAMRMFIFLTIS